MSQTTKVARCGTRAVVRQIQPGSCQTARRRMSA